MFSVMEYTTLDSVQKYMASSVHLDSNQLQINKPETLYFVSVVSSQQQHNAYILFSQTSKTLT